MPDFKDLGTVGAAGILVLLLLREIFSFLKGRKTNGSAGERSSEFWSQTIRDIIDRSLRDAVVTVLGNQSRILDELRTASATLQNSLNGIQQSLERLERRRGS